MWTTSVTGETAAPASAVWAALRDLHSGIPLGPESDRFELHGPFAVGTDISVTPHGQDTLTSRIVELEPDARYADLIDLGDVSLLFRHTLEPLAGGGTRVTHTLVVDGPAAATVGPELGPQISGDFPVALEELLAAAAER